MCLRTADKSYARMTLETSSDAIIRRSSRLFLDQSALHTDHQGFDVDISENGRKLFGLWSARVRRQTMGTLLTGHGEERRKELCPIGSGSR